MHLSRRRTFIGLLVLSQFICMTAGVWWSAQLLHKSFDRVIRRSAAAQSRSIVNELARRIENRSIEAIDPGSNGWNRLQRLCERMEAPFEGFISIVDAKTGALVCDSRLKSNPALSGTFPGLSPLAIDDDQEPLIAAVQSTDGEADEPVAGAWSTAGALQMTTCVSLPKLGAVAAVSLSPEAIDARVAEMTAPVMRIGFVVTIVMVGVRGVLTVLLVRRFDQTLSEMGESMEREIERRTLAITRSRNAVVVGLAKLAESRDKDAGQHLERLRTYVTILASEMAKHNSEIDHRYVANLATASALHDVGKMGVPDGVIFKVGRLTAAERRAMQMHTVLGGECIAGVARQVGDADHFLELGRQIAVSHHEQWDGSGYPHGLQGKNIPLAARIVALADVYDALTTHRAYRPAVSHVEALEWIVSNYGTQFDPEVVEAFVAREKDFAKLSQAALAQETAPAEAAVQESPAGATPTLTIDPAPTAV
jgi:response regulator RpfG family c-di-GMP phosphodiesterase